MTLAQGPGFGFSPDSSSPETNNGSMLFDEDSKDGLLFDDDKPLKRSSNGRKGPEAAGKRAQHNAIERARRESLNGRFMTLAEALPSMVNVKRPSKSIIVNKALDFVFDAQVKEHALIKENNDLRRQVDQLRARLGMAPLPPPTPLPTQRAASVQPSAAAAVDAMAVRPSSVAPVQLQQYHTSFTSAEGYHDEMAAAMGSLDANSSPGSQPSPNSPASTVSSPAIAGYASSLSNSYEELAPTSAAAPVSSMSAPAPHSPFLTLQQAHQHAALMQATAAGSFGYMNPALLSQQHTLMLAAQIQAQQQSQHMQDMYNWGSFGGVTGGEQHMTFMS